MTVHQEGPPDKKYDLLGHYRWKLVYAQGDYALTNRVCAEADRDIDREIGRARDSNEDSGTRDAIILLFHEGEPPWHVAVFNDCTPEYVKRLRVAYGRSPDDGMERQAVGSSEASEETEEDRTAKIVRLKAAGCSQRMIALELGVNQSTVSRVLAGSLA